MEEDKIKRLILLILTALLGLLAYAGPKLFIKYLSHIFPELSSIEETHKISDLILHILMLSIGLLMAYFKPMVKIWLWGIAGVILIPFYIFFIEIEIYPNSHNLWPLEFIFTYPYFAGLIIIGALLGKILNNKITDKKIKTNI